MDVYRRAPAVCISMLFRAGSVFEDERKAGISHFIEHLFYRGSRRRPKIRISEEILRVGGINSAGAWYDWTQFWSAVPKEHFDLALDGLMDCAFDMRLDEKEIEAERSVVIEEILRHDDELESVLFEEMLADLFPGSPFGRAIIGTSETVSGISAEDLREFHRSFYTPANLIVTVSGDVEPDEVFSKLENAAALAGCGGVLKKTAVPRPNRRYSESRSVERTTRCLLYISARIPPYAHADMPALAVLAELLGGGVSSLLHRRAVEEEKAASVLFSGLVQMEDAGVLYLSGIPLKYGGLFMLRNLIFRELAGIASSGAAARDVESAKKRCILKFLADSERVDDRAFSLAVSEAYGGWEISADFPERISTVAKEDVERAAGEYLSPCKMTGAFLVPEECASASDEEYAASSAEFDELLDMLGGRGVTAEHPGECGTASKTAADAFKPVLGGARYGTTPEKDFILSNGIRGFYRHIGGIPIAGIGIFARAGQVFEPNGLPGLANLAAEGMPAGTARLTKRDLQRETGLLGGWFSSNGFKDYSRLFMLVERRSLSRAAEILAEILDEPLYADAEMEKIKTLAEASLRERGENIVTTGFDAARVIIYSPHRYAWPLAGDSGGISRVSRKDLLDFHAGCFYSGNLMLCVCGDVSGLRLLPMLEKAFDRVPRGGGMRDFPAAVVKHRPGECVLTMGKKQAFAMLSYPAPGIGSGAYAAMEAARSILGFRIYRDIIYGKSLAYEAGAALEMNKLGGMFSVYAAAAPEKIEKCLAALRGLAENFRAGGPDESEIERARSGFIGARILDSQSVEPLMRDGAVWRIIGEESVRWRALKGEFEGLSREEVREAVKRQLQLENEITVKINFP